MMSSIHDKLEGNMHSFTVTCVYRIAERAFIRHNALTMDATQAVIQASISAYASIGHPYSNIKGSQWTLEKTTTIPVYETILGAFASTGLPDFQQRANGIGHILSSPNRKSNKNPSSNTNILFNRINKIIHSFFFFFYFFFIIYSKVVQTLLKVGGTRVY